MIIIDAEDQHIIDMGWQICNFHGYVYKTINGRRNYLHRYIMNCPKGMCVDHINGNKLDNRKINLRICTRQQNTQNRNKPKTSSNPYKGVYLSKDTRYKKPWRARIKIEGKLLDLKRCDTHEEAALVYNEAAIKYFGEFAHLNVLP